MRRFTSRILILVLLVSAVLEAVVPASASETANMLSDQIGKMYTANNPKANPTQSGRPAADRLIGTGGCLGYLLSHGNVSPKSESIFVGGSKKVRDRDYYIDYSAGSIVFADPVPQGEVVSVGYRYAPGDKGERTLVALPGLPIAATENLSMNLTYAYRVSGGVSSQIGSDLVTYGMNSTLKLGPASTLKSIFYTSNPQRRAPAFSLAERSAAPQGAQQAKPGSLMIEEGEFGFGRLKLKLGYQDVAESFAGFSMLQEAGSAPAEILARLAKEKGLKRIDLGASLDLGRGTSFSAGTNSIEDKSGDIENRSLGFASSRLKANYSMSEVGKNFSRAKDLRETNREQLAKETGIRRTSFGLEFASAGAKDSPWNRLNMNTISDASGRLDSRSAGFALGRLGFSYDHRSIGSGFKRLGSLSKDELTQMALSIRRQYDPGATAAQVTDADRQQVLTEAAMDRTNLRANFTAGPVKTDLQMLSINDSKGRIDRRSLGLVGRNYNLSFLTQDIDSGFGRLGTMSALEKAQFANERGIRRSSFLGAVKGKSGDLAMGLARVTDDAGASFLKQSLGFTGEKLSFKASFVDIDPKFTRMNDLADADKGQWAQEIGWRRRDISANLNFSPRMMLESFYCSADNSSNKLSRNQLRNKLTYTTKLGPRIVAFRDQFSSDPSGGKSSGYLHQWITLDHKFAALSGLLFNGLRDINVQSNVDGSEVTSTVTQMHLESNKGKRTWVAAERKEADFGKGRFENLQSFNLSSKPMRNINVTGLFSTTKRETGKEDTLAYGLQWAVTSKLNFSADVMDKDGAKTGTTAKRTYGLSGMLADRLAFFRSVKLSANRSSEDKEGALLKDARVYSIESDIPQLLVLKNLKLSISRTTENNAKMKLKDVYSFKLGSEASDFGMFKNAKLLLSRTSEDKDAKHLKDATAFRFESNVYRGNLIAEFSAQEDASKKRPFTRALNFISDRSDKNRLKFDVMYKSRGLGQGTPLLIRNYNLDYKLSARTNFSYGYFSYREKPENKIDTVGGSVMKLSTILGRYTYVLNFKQDSDFTKKSDRATYGLGIASKLDSGALVEAGYSIDNLTAAGSRAKSQVYTVKYDQQVSEDHFLTLTTEYRATNDSAPGTRKDIQARVDLRRVFN